MYAQLVMFTIGPGMRAKAEQIADKFNLAHKNLKGFKNATFLGDHSIGDYSSVAIQETPEDLQAASNILRPKLQEALSGIAKGEPTVRVFEVYEPKG